MICFKDMTFCVRSGKRGKCINYECPRNLNKKLQAQGKRWFGSEHYPVCYSDLKNETCGYKEDI